MRVFWFLLFQEPFPIFGSIVSRLLLLYCQVRLYEEKEAMGPLVLKE